MYVIGGANHRRMYATAERVAAKALQQIERVHGHRQVFSRFSVQVCSARDACQGGRILVHYETER
jgi:hypothetical protein